MLYCFNAFCFITFLSEVALSRRDKRYSEGMGEYTVVHPQLFLCVLAITYTLFSMERHPMGKEEGFLSRRYALYAHVQSRFKNIRGYRAKFSYHDRTPWRNCFFCSGSISPYVLAVSSLSNLYRIHIWHHPSRLILKFARFPLQRQSGLKDISIQMFFARFESLPSGYFGRLCSSFSSRFFPSKELSQQRPAPFSWQSYLFHSLTVLPFFSLNVFLRT